VAAAVLALALFFEPVVAAMADFPAMVVPVLTGGGFLLLLLALTNGKLAAAEPERRAEMLAVITLVLLLPLSGNFVTALGASLLGYALFMSMAGNARQVTGATWLLSGLFGLYFLYGSIF
jgi:AGZA family xanthine/uracil permease-like MFS transporter